MIVDAQVHAYEGPRPDAPWKATPHGPTEVTGRDMAVAMDAVGVAGGLLVSQYSVYGYNADYICRVHAEHPGRFALVKPVDVTDPGIEQVVRDWAATDGVIGIRILLMNDAPTDPDHAGIATAVSTAASCGLRVNLMCKGRLAQAAALAARHPNAQFVIDHLGLRQPFGSPATDAVFNDLPDLLSVAPHHNIAVKLTGIGTMSRRPFPFDDLWSPLARILDAFGVERCMWGSDWTRVTDFLNYAESVQSCRLAKGLSQEELAMVMGGNITRIYGWSPTLSECPAIRRASTTAE